MSDERTRNENFSAGPDPFADDFATTVMTEGDVDVIHGVHAHSFPIAGRTVSQARPELEERFNIDPEATPYVDGVQVDDDTVLAEGQVLTFNMHAGEKGG